MRAPDPEKWKATEMLVGPLMSALCLSAKYSSSTVLYHVAIVANAVARRRALEELRAIRDAYPEQTQALHDRIAEIEAEGE